MNITIYGLTFPGWFWLPVALVLVLIVALGVYATRRQRMEQSAALEAERDYDNGKPAAALEAGPLLTDDDYPAQPALSAAAGPQTTDSDVSGAAGPDAIRSADGPSAADLAAGTHQLAALTEGETVIEEIERLEARLAALYELLGEEIAADVAQVDLMLASGALAAADWLPHPFAYDGLRPYCEECAGLPGDTRHDPRRWDSGPVLAHAGRRM